MTLDTNKSKVKKGKNVILSGQVDSPEAACESAIVALQRKKPSETEFTTLEQVQTDAAGNFSAKEKVKKTYEFRGEVTEVGGCAAGLSDTEKVKAKK